MVLPREGSQSERAVPGGKQQSSRRGGQQPPILSLPPHAMHKAPSCHRPRLCREPGPAGPSAPHRELPEDQASCWLRAGALSDWMGRVIQPWPPPQPLP